MGGSEHPSLGSQVPAWMWTTGRAAVPCRPARPMRRAGVGPLKASTTSRRRGGKRSLFFFGGFDAQIVGRLGFEKYRVYGAVYGDF